MSGNPSMPPTYDDAMKASAPPQEGGMDYPLYPAQHQTAPYPAQQNHPMPQNYPMPPQQNYPMPPQQGYPPPNAQNYGAAPAPVYPPQQYPPQVSVAPGQYNYSTVTVVSNPGAVTGPVSYAPIPVPSNQLLAQQRSRRRLCFVIFIVGGIILGAVIIIIIIQSSAVHED